MNKQCLLFCTLLLAGFGAGAQTKGHKAPKEPGDQAPRIDTTAVSILDRMSAMISSMNSCTYSVHANYDIPSHYLGVVKHSDEQKVYLKGGDKLLIESNGDKGTRSYVYNGTTFDYLSRDKNQYGELTVPAKTMDMIDSVNKAYGVEFPASDFFYPTFVDDIVAESRTLIYLGITQVDGKDCFHVAGASRNKTFQFWISDDAYTLPVKMVIVYTQREMSPQYEETLTDWQINPDLPDALFSFTPPPGAKKIKLIASTTMK
jgi:hypothetical protein